MDVHVTNYNRRTLLHVAVIWSNLSIVQYLLTKNVDINAVDVYGYTALNYAETDEIFDLLVSKNAVKNKVSYRI